MPGAGREDHRRELEFFVEFFPNVQQDFLLSLVIKWSKALVFLKMHNVSKFHSTTYASPWV